MLIEKWLNHRAHVSKHSSASVEMMNLAIVKLPYMFLSLFIFPAKHRTGILLYAEGKTTLWIFILVL